MDRDSLGSQDLATHLLLGIFLQEQSCFWQMRVSNLCTKSSSLSPPSPLPLVWTPQTTLTLHTSTCPHEQILSNTSHPAFPRPQAPTNTPTRPHGHLPTTTPRPQSQALTPSTLTYPHVPPQAPLCSSAIPPPRTPHTPPGAPCAPPAVQHYGQLPVRCHVRSRRPDIARSRGGVGVGGAAAAPI